jgi:hypothetical protein
MACQPTTQVNKERRTLTKAEIVAEYKRRYPSLAEPSAKKRRRASEGEPPAKKSRVVEGSKSEKASQLRKLVSEGMALLQKALALADELESV